MSELIRLFEMTAQQAHTMAKEQSVTGAPIVIGDVTVVPVSKISCGFSYGGSDKATGKNGALTAGAGAKITKTPLSFLAVWGGNVQILSVSEEEVKKNGLINAIAPLIVSLKEKAAAKKAAKEAEESDRSAQ